MKFWLSIAAAFAIGTATGCFIPQEPEVALVHPDRKLPHVVYLRDTAGDCVALFGMSLTRASSTFIQHVDKRWCE
jgi:hypothetical protein